MITVINISFLVCIIALIATAGGALLLLIDDRKADKGIDFLNPTADEVAHWVVNIGLIVVGVSWLTAFVLGYIVFF